MTNEIKELIEEMINSRKIKAVIIKQALYYYNSNREGSLWWKQKRKENNIDDVNE